MERATVEEEHATADDDGLGRTAAIAVRLGLHVTPTIRSRRLRRASIDQGGSRP
jgi:hypothetical protein